MIDFLIVHVNQNLKDLKNMIKELEGDSAVALEMNIGKTKINNR